MRVAVQGGVERYVRRYEQYAFRYDPLLQYLADEHHPVCETQLFTEQEWQQQPLRKALTMRRLVRMMEAPIVTESSPVGTLFFTRRPDQPPFIEADMRIARTVSRHVTAAVKNALDYQRTREQQCAAEGVLQVIGSALILTDSMGDIRFANKQAEEFLAFCGDMGAQRDRLRRALRDNVNQLFNAGISTAVSVVPAAPSRLGSAAGSILLRSVRVPGSDGTVATFICSQSSGGLQMEHLTGLLPQRALEVLELVAKASTGGRDSPEAFRVGEHGEISPEAAVPDVRRRFTLGPPGKGLGLSTRRNRAAPALGHSGTNYYLRPDKDSAPRRRVVTSEIDWR